MKVHIQVNLMIVTALYLLWALYLFMGQQQAQPLLSNGPYDAVASAMLGASLFALVVLFLIALLNPLKELVYASVVALALLALVFLYQLFLSDGMPHNPATFFSFLISATVGAILFFSMIQSPATIQARPRAAAGRRKIVRKTRVAKATKKTSTRTKVRKTKKKTGTGRRKRR